MMQECGVMDKDEDLRCAGAVRNKYGQKVMVWCQSCQNHVPGVGKLCKCKLLDMDVDRYGVCGEWSMALGLRRAGSPECAGDGWKPKAYFDWLVKRRAAWPKDKQNEWNDTVRRNAYEIWKRENG